MAFTLSKKGKALLSLVLGLVLMVVGYAISPLVSFGYLPPVAGAIIGVSLPLAVQEVDEPGSVSVSDVETLAQKVITILEQSGKLNATEESIANIVSKVIASLQSQGVTVTSSSSPAKTAG